MNVVVMAAGEGRRLRPLTHRWPKPVLPIDGRPVVVTLIREVAAAALGPITVVTGHLADQIESLLGDGSAFGVRIRYVRQPHPLGSADAVRRAVAAGAEPPLVVLGADTVFSPGDLATVADSWLASGTPGGLGVRRAATSAKTAVEAADGVVLHLGAASGGDLTAAPLWFLGAELAASLEQLSGPPFELAAAVQNALDGGTKIAALDLGPTRDLTRPEDVVRLNFPYLLSRGKSGFPREPPSS
jgi:CTP:molybdopterin cytidylyltransferase MocA